MEVARGEIWWAELPPPLGSESGNRRPVLVVQANEFNNSKIATIVVAALTTNLRLGAAPGNVLVGSKESGLRQDSVVNVTQISTIDRSFLRTKAGRLKPESLRAVEDGIRLVLAL